MVGVDAEGVGPGARVSASVVLGATGCSISLALNAMQDLVDFSAEALHYLSLLEDTKSSVWSLYHYGLSNLLVLDFVRRCSWWSLF